MISAHSTTCEGPLGHLAITRPELLNRPDRGPRASCLGQISDAPRNARVREVSDQSRTPPAALKSNPGGGGHKRGSGDIVEIEVEKPVHRSRREGFPGFMAKVQAQYAATVAARQAVYATTTAVRYLRDDEYAKAQAAEAAEVQKRKDAHA
jgi:hypothetical protein